MKVRAIEGLREAEVKCAVSNRDSAHFLFVFRFRMRLCRQTDNMRDSTQLRAAPRHVQLDFCGKKATFRRNIRGDSCTKILKLSGIDSPGIQRAFHSCLQSARGPLTLWKRGAAKEQHFHVFNGRLSSACISRECETGENANE